MGARQVWVCSSQRNVWVAQTFFLYVRCTCLRQCSQCSCTGYFDQIHGVGLEPLFYTECGFCEEARALFVFKKLGRGKRGRGGPQTAASLLHFLPFLRIVCVGKGGTVVCFHILSTKAYSESILDNVSALLALGFLDGSSVGR